MKNYITVLLVFIQLLNLGCQAMVYGTASQFEGLSLGMSKEEVIHTLGSPDATAADGDKREEYLIYKKMKHAVSWAPKTYQVTLRDGRVVKWDEAEKRK